MKIYRSLFYRIIVHVICLTVSSIIASNLYGENTGKDDYQLMGYIGLICIFGRQLNNRFGGWIPAIFGLIEVAIAALLGANFFSALLIGGVLAWLVTLYERVFLRCYRRKVVAKTEWIALVMLILCFFAELDSDAYFASLSIIPVFIAAALYAPSFLHLRVFNSISQDLEKISSILGSFGQDTFQKQQTLLRDMDEQAKKLKVTRFGSSELRPFFDISFMVEDLLRASGQIKTITVAQDFEFNVRRIGAAIDEIYGLFQQNAKFSAISANQSGTAISASGFDNQVFRNNVSIINGLAEQLPKDYADLFNSLSVLADRIINCMSSDPNDVARGSRFLNRYLPIIITIGQKHIAFLDQKPNDEAVIEINEQNLAILKKLEAAFAVEHSNLLKNDIMEMNVETKTLERLLKLDGFE